jgi:ADP-dependent NAD(P)H-hydrate dehydratase / NAD(P)H-hydrate epimerase
MKILTADQMREADRLTTERYGIPSEQLMENAGAAVANYIVTAYPDLATRKIVVLCGKGNNGGDGFVVARHLQEQHFVPRVILFAEPSTLRGDAAANLKRWQEMGDLRLVTSKAQWDALRPVIGEAGIIVDALLGTGLTGPVEGLLAAVIGDLNAASRPGLRPGSPGPDGSRLPDVVSVDMPSGLPSGVEDYGGPVVVASATVTLTAPKVGQMLSPRADCVGKLVVRQIGTPRALLDDDSRLRLHWLEPGEFRDLPLIRKRDANKGSFGHVLLVAGSVGKTGAAVMGGRAALRVGAGLVTVATPSDALPVVAAGMPELMTAPLASTDAGTVSMDNIEYGRWDKLAAGKSVLAIGPGLSTDPQTRQFIQTVFAEATLPVILDADGLNAFDGETERLASRKAPLVAMTPHPGEMGRLVGATPAEVQQRRLDVALESAARWRAYVVLKGSHTILATPDGRAFINSTGNPGMAKGGTGDVLTGMLAGLTAEFGTAHWEIVLGLGVYLHGLAGDLAAARVGETPLVASDIIDALPEAFAHLIAEWSSAKS